MIHNVFSTRRPGNIFDLGTIKGGGTSRQPGSSCSSRGRWRCSATSTRRCGRTCPGGAQQPFWAGWPPTARFRSPASPPGPVSCVLWTPSAKPISQQVEVTSKGGNVTFSAESSAIRPPSQQTRRRLGSSISQGIDSGAGSRRRSSSAACCWSGRRGSRADMPAREGSGRAAADATALRLRLEQVVRSTTRALEPKATAASRLQGIMSGLDLDADAHTFEDLLENEDWWAPVSRGVPNLGCGRGVGLARGARPRRRRFGGDAHDPASTRAGRRVGGGLSRGPLPDAGRCSRPARQATRVGGGEWYWARRSTGPRCSQSRMPRRPRWRCRTASACSGQRGTAGCGRGTGRDGGARIRRRGGGDDVAGVVVLPLDRGLWLLSMVPGGAPRSALPAQPLILLTSGGALSVLGLALALGTRRRRRVNTANPMAITQPMGSGSGIYRGGPQTSETSRRDMQTPALARGRARLRGLSRRRRSRGRPRTTHHTRDRRDARPRLTGAALAEVAAAPDPTTASPSAPLPASPSGPVSLGRYRLLERIGEGGMAEIFVAAAHGAEGFVRYFVVILFDVPG